MKRYMQLLLLLTCICLTTEGIMAQTYWNGTVVKDWTGTGTESDPFLISTPEQLAGLADTVNSGDPFVGKYIRLSSDIWLTDTTIVKDLRPEWDPIGHHVMHDIGEKMDSASFSGHFDGAGHTIHFLYTGSVDGFSGWDDLDDPTFSGTVDGSTWYKALFGFVNEEATIRNLHLKETAITGSADVAGLVLYNRGTIEDCSMEGLVFGGGDVGSFGGGLVYENHGTIARCTVHGKSQAARNVGMIAGYNAESGVIRDCYTRGYLRATQYNAGGVVGSNFGLVENCGADVQTSKSAYNYGSGPDCGGFVGRNEGTIRNCYSLGEVSAAVDHGGGGFVGTNTGRIESCYATGDCYGGYGRATGAFVGTNGYYEFYNGWSNCTPGIIINCFATGRNYYDGAIYGYGFCESQVSGSNSLLVNCYYITNYGIDTSNDNAYVGGSELRDSSMLQTQAFVDTLNMVAAWAGTSAWQYNPGGYPIPTGQVAANITDYCGGGNGSETNPFRIGTKEHLVNFAAVVNKGYDFREQHILQTADINLNRPMGEWGEEMPTTWRPVGDIAHGYQHDFRGNYNGGFYEVRNLYLNNFNEGQGFFGCLNHGAVVRNLGITDVWMKAKGSIGIVAGFSSRYAENVIISQCWTSGQAEGEWAAGGILGNIALDGKTDILNCRSMANITAVQYAAAVVSDQNYVGGESFSNDTVGNFLFTGTLVTKSNPNRGRIVPMSGYECHFNGYYDNDVLPIYTADQEKERHDACAATTAYLQGMEVVNIYNAWVDKYNLTHTFQLDYWQQNVGRYPSVSPAFVPPHTVRLVSNGGGVYADIHALDSSLVPMPKIPVKEGRIFGGWYSDAACTQLFVFDTARVVSDTTLYAKWVEPINYDISIFQNPFATSYTIRTVGQLYGFAVAVNGLEGVIDPMTFEGKTVRLANDIVVNDPACWAEWGNNAMAVPFTPVGHYGAQFLGTFDGQGYTITGLYINGLQQTGLFGYIGVGGIVKNTHIKRSVLQVVDNPGNYHGLLAGVCRGTVEHCTVQGKVTGSIYKGIGATDVGGLIGNVGGYYAGESGGKVTCCSADVEVSGQYTVGGLIGSYNSKDTILYCYTKGKVSGSTAGGISGVGTKMANCYSMADVNVYKGSSGNTAGGLMNGSAAVKNSYYAGTVRIGDVTTDGVTSSSSNELVSVYYLSHNAPRSNGKYGTSLLDMQMHTKQSFEGFDFDNVWGRKDTINGGYPYLRWEYEEYIPDDPDAEYVPVESVTLDITQKEMLRGTSFQLKATVLPENASVKEITWAVSNIQNLSVDENGVVTALENTSSASLTATVTVHTVDGNKTATCKVTTINPYIDFGGLYYYQPANKEIQMQCSVYPDSLTAPLVYSSQYDSVATVDGNGLIHTLSEGKTYIYVSTIDGRVSGSKQLTIYEKHITSVSLLPNYHNDQIGIGETWQMRLSYSPSDATNTKMYWSSSNPDIIAVDGNGNITGLAIGTSTITVRSDDGGHIASQEITVILAPVTGVRITSYPSSLRVGETYQLEATIEPSSATDKRVSWKSSNENVLRVDETGMLTALAESSRVTVTVTTVEGGYTDYVRIRVSGYTDIPTLTTFAIEPDAVTLEAGDMFQLSTLIEPLEAEAYTKVVWESGNTDVAIVENGLLTALKDGITNVTAVASCGIVSQIASCKVTVTSLPTAVELPDNIGSVDVQKILKDGTVFILRNGKLYTITGIEVK